MIPHFFLPPQASNTSSPSSLFALDLDCYFTEKIETIIRELPQVPTNTSTRPPASGPDMLFFSLVTRSELSIFLSKAELSTCSLDPNSFEYSRRSLQKFLLFPSPASSFFCLTGSFHQHTNMMQLLSSMFPSSCKLIFPFFSTAVSILSYLYSYL